MLVWTWHEANWIPIPSSTYQYQGSLLSKEPWAPPPTHPPLVLQDVAQNPKQDQVKQNNTKHTLRRCYKDTYDKVLKVITSGRNKGWLRSGTRDQGGRKKKRLKGWEQALLKILKCKS